MRSRVSGNDVGVLTTGGHKTLPYDVGGDSGAGVEGRLTQSPAVGVASGDVFGSVTLVPSSVAAGASAIAEPDDVWPAAG